jgi:hypothetical protein
MKIEVIRTKFDDTCSIGEMLVDGSHECYTLEPVTRPADAEKIFGKTAIPYGTYPVTVSFSGHFQRDMPLLVGVPNFSEVRIHPGNYASNTEGCCLVGEGESADAITQSVAAFDALWPKIRDAVANGEEVTITYTDGS